MCGSSFFSLISSVYFCYIIFQSSPPRDDDGEGMPSSMDEEDEGTRLQRQASEALAKNSALIQEFPGNQFSQVTSEKARAQTAHVASGLSSATAPFSSFSPQMLPSNGIPGFGGETLVATPQSANSDNKDKDDAASVMTSNPFFPTSASPAFSSVPPFTTTIQAQTPAFSFSGLSPATILPPVFVAPSSDVFGLGLEASKGIMPTPPSAFVFQLPKATTEAPITTTTPPSSLFPTPFTFVKDGSSVSTSFFFFFFFFLTLLIRTI